MWSVSKSTLLVCIALISQYSFAEFDSSLPFISKAKFDVLKSKSAGTWARDGAEMEMTYKFTCNDPNTDSLVIDKGIFKVLSANNYEKFKKMVKCKDCTSIAQGLGSPELMSWDKVAHAIRMNLGYLPLTVEPERLEPNESPSALKLSYGADLMDDIYFDTDDFTAINHYYALRARKRWDSANPTVKPEMRRILIGLKETPPIDPAKGLKIAMKIDDRFDEPSIEQILSFSAEVPTGVRNNHNQQTPIPSVIRLYEGLAAKGVLKDEGSELGVLQLKPKTFLRSLRLRFHYGSTEADKTIELLNYSKAVLNETSELAKTLDTTSLTETEKKSVAKIISIAETISNPALFLESKGLHTGDLITDNMQFQASGTLGTQGLSLLTFEQIQNAVSASEAMSNLFREAGYEIEHNAHLFAKEPKKGKEAAGIKKLIYAVAPKQKTYSPSVVPEAASYFVRILSALIEKEGLTRTTEILNTKLEELKKQTNNTVAEVQPFTEKQVEDSLAVFKFKKFDEGGRQVEAGFSAHKQMAYILLNVAIVGQYYESLNMFIDTVDFVGMFKAGPIEVDEYNPAAPNDPPIRKVVDFNLLTNNHVITGNAIEQSLIGTYLSNDVQLELGQEKPFLQALKTHDADPVKKANAQWILDQIGRFQKQMARLKVLSLNSFVDKADAAKAGCSKFSWKPTDMPKGESSLKKLIEMGKSQNAQQ